jgi:hypothetical protein
MDAGGSIPEEKAAGHGADHSPPSSAEVTTSGALPPSPIYLNGIELNYVIKFRDNLITAVSCKSTTIRDVMSCSLVDV